MSNEVLALIGSTAVETLAAKYSASTTEIETRLAAGHEGLRANFDELVQTGLAIVARKALGYCA